MKATILLVDDEQDAREPIRLVLENNYKVLCASSGAEALQILEKEEVHLIIADQRMPQMTGVELLSRVRKSYPNIVRLILTAYTDFDAMLKAINEGQVYRYIIKPWDANDMLLTIRQALEHRELLISNGHLADRLSQAKEALSQPTHELEQALVCQRTLSAVRRITQDVLDQMDNYLHEMLSLGENISDQPGAAAAMLKEKTSMLLSITSDMRDRFQQANLPPNPLSNDSNS